MAWKFVIGDRNGQPIAELVNADPRNVYIALSRVYTGDFTVQTNNRHANLMRSMDQCTIKAYRDNVLLMNGPIAPSYNKTVSDETKTIKFNFASAGWRFARRDIPSSKSVAGATYPSDLLTNPTNTMDLGQIAAAIINDCNTEALPAGVVVPASDTNVRVGTIGTIGSTSVGPWNYKNALQGLAAVSSLLSGFDWQIVATEPVIDDLGVQFGVFNAALNIGQLRPDCWFEYGDGKHNVASWNEVGDISAIANRFYSLPSGFPSSPATAVVTDYNVQSINDRGVIYEDVISNDLTTLQAQQLLIAQNLTVRAFPRIVITFQPTVTSEFGVVPQYGRDYLLGDIVGFRAVEDGVETVNGLFRVYAVSFAIDKNGNETATPTLLSTDVSDVITTSPVGA